MLYSREELRELWIDFFMRYYLEDIQYLHQAYPEKRSIVIDFEKLVDYNSDFAYDFLNNPEIHFDEVKYAVYDLLEDSIEINVRIANAPSYAFRKVNDIQSEDIGKFIKIDGVVRKVSDARPIITVAVWECSDCGGKTYINTEDGTLKKPLNCAVCGKKRGKVSFKLMSNESKKINFKYIEVQDIPENVGTSQPRKLEIHFYDDLALMKINPGDRLEISGIIRATPIGPRNMPSAQMQIYMVANYVVKKNKDWSTIELSESDKEEIIKLSKSPELINLFKQSIAPSIWGYDTIKEALVLQMFGGVPKRLPSGTRKRGDIHILIVGDPGTAKSEILMQVATIAPRAIYTSGKGTSAAGLTAAAIKDKNNIWTLEAGALVIADNGMVCIDEIDKMSNEDRGAIHTAMEQQIVAIDKAGIHITLPARCSILAAANPVHGRFDTTYSLSSQINLDPPLLTRFDAIFKLVDEPDTSKDNALAKHLIDVHHAGETENVELNDRFKPSIDIELLRKYIVYAKQIKPIMTDEVRKFLQETYVKMRNSYNDTGVVSITPRQLEAMIRFAEASARLRLSNTVNLEDAKRAVKIVEYYLKDVAADTTEGIIDIDTLYGLSSRMRKIVDELHSYIYSIDSITIKELYSLFGDKYTSAEIDQALDYLQKQRKIIISGYTVKIR